MSDNATLQTSRTLPFPPESVYGAFASADLLASWWGPAGFTNEFEVFEFREGGRWRFVMVGPDGHRYQNESVFMALDPGVRVVIRHVCEPLFTLTVDLERVGDGTRVAWRQRFADAAVAQAVQRLVGPANEQNLDRLTLTLAQAAGRA